MSEKLSLREKQRARNRGLIIDGAQEAFLEIGFDAATLIDIARHAEVSPGTVRNYFGDKDGVFRALVSDEFLIVLERLRDAVKDAEGLEQTIRAMFRVLFQRMGESPETYAMAQRNLPAVKNVLEIPRLATIVTDVLHRKDRFNGDRSVHHVDGSYIASAGVTLGIELGRILQSRPQGDIESAIDFATMLSVGGIARMRAGGARENVGNKLADSVRRAQICEIDQSEPESSGLRERNKAGTRAAILAAARDSFAELGFAATGVREIGARADIAPGTVYNYFADKEEIFVEIANEYFGMFVEQVWAVRIMAGDLEELIGSQFRIAYEMTAQEPVLFELMLRNIWEVREMMPSLDSLVRYATEITTDTFLMVEQELLPPVDVEFFVTAIVALGFEIGRLSANRRPPDFDHGTKFATDLFTGGLLMMADRDPTVSTNRFKKRLVRNA